MSVLESLKPKHVSMFVGLPHFGFVQVGFQFCGRKVALSFGVSGQVYALFICSSALPLQQLELVFCVRFLCRIAVAHITLSKSWVTLGAVLCAWVRWFTFLYGGVSGRATN
ncbi:hypothetical protein H4F18_18905 [Vibrio scophthalmi]|uniref:hypothetical protein n=1 Tax=Vibrio scophthalmi TaxID=45658 RepID=UPI002FF23E7A